jgi:hypothetical protein
MVIEAIACDEIGRDEVADALAFIAEHPHVYLLSRRADGFPTGYAMTAQVQEGCVVFSTYAKSAKVINLRREPQARVLATDEAGLATVEVGGPIREVDASRWLDGPAGAAGADGGPVTARSGMGSVPPEVQDHVRRAHQSDKRVVLELTVEHVRRGRSLLAGA